MPAGSGNRLTGQSEVGSQRILVTICIRVKTFLEESLGAGIVAFLQVNVHQHHGTDIAKRGLFGGGAYGFEFGGSSIQLMCGHQGAGTLDTALVHLSRLCGVDVRLRLRTYASNQKSY